MRFRLPWQSDDQHHMKRTRLVDKPVVWQEQLSALNSFVPTALISLGSVFLRIGCLIRRPGDGEQENAVLQGLDVMHNTRIKR